MRLSDVLIQRVVAVNRVNRLLGNYVVKNRPQCTLSYKISGHSEFVQHGNKYISDRNHIVFVPAGASYTFNCQETGECILLEFEASQAGDELQSFLIHNDVEVLSLFSKIEQAHTFRKAGYDSYCMSGLYRLFYYMDIQTENAYVVDQKKKRIQPGLDYLEAHICDPSLNSKTLADISGISEVYFRKLFTLIYGLPLKHYIHLTRMEKAKGMLLSREMSIRQVAAETGFSAEEIEARFGFMVHAFGYGTPPHAGFSFGLDRLVMLLLGESSLREVIAFPKVKDASCPMTDAPTPVDAAQLSILGLTPGEAAAKAGRQAAR